MSARHILMLLCILLLTSFSTALRAEDKLKVLIVDGQNNHGVWPKSTSMMKKYLEESERFEVDVERTQFTWKGGALAEEYKLDDGKSYQELPEPKSDPDFAPEFANYDVVLVNFGWKAAPWPEATQKAFEAYVAKGGGVVIVHAADNSFPEWPAYNKMIGLGGWGGRNESSGPYVYFDKSGKEVRDEAAGRGGSHGPKHEYQIVVRDAEHPITAGLPNTWLHTSDELYQQLRGPASNMQVLATAFASPDFRGSDRHEPMLMTIQYEQGRVFHTPMGHDETSFECVGFITVLLRGTEWAGTGKVTLTEVPEDFPSADKISIRDF